MHSQEGRSRNEHTISHAQKELAIAKRTIERLETELKAAAREKEQELQQVKVHMQEFYLDLVESGTITYQRQLADYEEQLGQIQMELAEKDKQIEMYNQQIKSLEKKLSLHKSLDFSLAQSVDSDETKTKYSGVAYFDYAVIFYGNKTGLIKGSLHMENTGVQPLWNPYVCLRFNPVEAASIKGKILTQEKLETTTENLADFHWMFVDNEWAARAKERGEIWICPINEMKIMPGESVSINDYRIPLNKNLYDSITIEAFISYNKKQFKIKAANRIDVYFKQYCLKCMKDDICLNRRKY